jgi:molecular chaperone DnaK
MYLGIDLGTSNSAVVGNQNGDLRLFKTIDGTDTLPSVIMQERNGGLYVGKKAYDQLQTSPQSVVARFKRLLGTKTELKIARGDRSISPEEASAEVLRTLMKQVDSAFGSVDIEGCIVTVPAAFNQLQSEATARAANDAGLDHVGLLQEPIAAAMASLEKASGKDGLFLVYDLGGGTFDVALVRSISNTVTIEAHEGINMLGGGDFDRSILNAIIHPWVHTHFDIADNANADAAFKRMFAIARHAAERAKIELSSREDTTIYVSEDETRVLDQSGKEIFIEIPFSRKQLNDLIIERIDQSIDLCRKTISDNGYTNDDIDRIVLIGGPSHMSIVREYVPQELGIPVDLQTDPMTAVARGAAIYAESREWTGSGSTRKAARNREQVGGNVKVSYDYEARITTDNARVRATGDGDVSGFRVSATTDGGRDYGEQALSESPVFSIVLNNTGATTVRMTVTDTAGRKVEDASTEFKIVKAIAEAASMPCTHTISVKVAKDAGTEAQNRLSPIVKKGTPLPQKGTTVFHSNRRLDPSNPGHIDAELFQQAEGVEDFEANLFIGALRIDALDLPQDGQSALGIKRQSDDFMCSRNTFLGGYFGEPQFLCKRIGRAGLWWKQWA